MSEPDVPSEGTQFSFWLGDWQVFSPAGSPVGTNKITPLYGGRVLVENWSGKGGVEGTSLNAWDPERKCWHQTWMDSTGSTLLLDGAFEDGQMVLEGVSEGDGVQGPQRNRITWTPSADGAEVRQLWEVSADDGKTWTVGFDGCYRRITSD